MKKRYFLILFLFFVLLSGCTHEKVKTDEEILDYIANNITFEEEINHDLDLHSTYDYEDKVINAKWTSENENYLSNQGERFATEDRFINLTVELTLNDKTLTKKFELFILGISQEDFVMKILSLMPNIEQTPYKIELPKQINMLSRNYNVQWKSQNKDIANDNGDIIPDDKDRSVTFEASITYLNTTVNKTIQIDVPKFDTNILDLERVMLNAERSYEFTRIFLI